jgi:hypothetical protein
MDWLRHPLAWLASRLTQPQLTTPAESWAIDLRERVSSALAEGMPGR